MLESARIENLHLEELLDVICLHQTMDQNFRSTVLFDQRRADPQIRSWSYGRAAESDVVLSFQSS